MFAGVLPLRSAVAPSVLVIDDDANIREFLTDFLHLEGFQVTALADPSVAVERIRGGGFDLIMLDVMMPKICGLDLLPEIRVVDDSVPVIMMTSYPSLETVASAIPHGIAGYIGHPLTVPELREAILRVTTKRGFMLRGEDALPAAIGKQVRNLRRARGMTLEHVARRTKFSVSQLSQIERGEATLSVSDLGKLADALHVRVTALLAGR
ncbi:MAG TPA: response regulator [Kofleriaceae bacterium]|nr:response regulator [Kofleriaceae bacterium]